MANVQQAVWQVAQVQFSTRFNHEHNVAASCYFQTSVHDTLYNLIL